MRVLEIDFARNGDAVVGDRGGAPRLVDHDIAALRAESDLDSVSDSVHAAHKGATGFFVEFEMILAMGLMPSWADASGIAWDSHREPRQP